MPNWCEHDITISGYDIATIDSIERSITTSGSGRDRSFLSALLPMPKALEGTRSPESPPYSQHDIDTCEDQRERSLMERDNAEYNAQRALLREKYGASTWYDWSIHAWGTKWPDTLWSIERKPRSITLSGACAWSPPLAGLVAISSMYPTVRITIRYFEAGIGFTGKAVVAGGEIRSHSESSYRGRRGG